MEKYNKIQILHFIYFIYFFYSTNTLQYKIKIKYIIKIFFFNFFETFMINLIELRISSYNF